MKTHYLISFGFMFLAVTGSSQSIFEEWKELEAYHQIMSATYHPAQEGEFEPIKTRSIELVAVAKSIKPSGIPASFSSSILLKTVKQLKKETKALDLYIRKKNPTNDEIMVELEALHDVFHQVVGLCRDEHG